MNLLINIPDDFQDAFYNDRLVNMLKEIAYNLYSCEGIDSRCIQFVKGLISCFSTAIPVNVRIHTEKTKYGYVSEEVVSWSREAEERLNKESTILKLYDLKEQNEKLKKLLSKMIYVLSDPATTNIEKITTCCGYDLDRILGEDWRKKYAGL